MRTRSSLAVFGLIAAFVGAPVGAPTWAYPFTSTRDGHVAQISGQKDSPLPSSARSINLTEENRHVIREIILKDPNVHRQDAPRAVIGNSSPTGVVMQPFPAEVTQKIPSLRSLAYFVSDDSVVIVDPNDKRVADIVEPAK
jgi:hypothetical protein